jgi:hypothetical protein
LHPWTKTCDFKYIGWSTRLEQNAPDLYGEALYNGSSSAKISIVNYPICMAVSQPLHKLSIPQAHIAFVVDSIQEGQVEAEVLAQPISEFVNRACAGEELAIILVE